MGGFSAVKGPITAKFSTIWERRRRSSADVDLDLTHASIKGLPGITKPAGKAAKVSFSLTRDDKGLQFDQLAVDVAPVQARGSVQLGSDLSLISAKFPQVKFSPGDEMRVEVTKSGDGYKINAHGGTFDGRPFLRMLTFSKSDQGPAADDDTADDKDADEKPAADKGMFGDKDIEVDLKAASLTGYNKTTLSGADLHLVKRGDNLREFTVSGRFPACDHYRQADQCQFAVAAIGTGHS